MFIRAVSLLAMFTTLLLLAACDTGEPSGAEYLSEEIPPCTPVTGSTVDPCEPGLQWIDGGGQYSIGPEPRGLRLFLGDGSYGWTHVTHLVVRGTFLPGGVRCTSEGDVFRPPPHLSVSWPLSYNSKSIKCYADIRVNAYVVGSGPPTMTLMVGEHVYPFPAPQEIVDEWIGSLEQLLTEGGSGNNFTILPPEGGYVGREMVLFLGPSVDVSAEAWDLFHTWDVQLTEDDTAIAVHPFRDDWERIDDFETYRSQLEMELSAFTQAVATANQARITEYGGRIAPSDIDDRVEGIDLPMLATDANRLSDFYTAIGAYNHPNGPPEQPPPPCGFAMPGQAHNAGLMRECQAMLAAKDSLRGTAPLNWSVDTVITGWDGVTTSGTPSRVTELDLSSESLSGIVPPELRRLSELTSLDMSSNSLTGEIPRELGELSNLTELKLSGNSLTGCIPLSLKNVMSNDLSSLNLLNCPPAPQGLAGTSAENSIALSWHSVTNATKYRVEYRHRDSPEWTVDDDTITGTTHTLDELKCYTWHQFRVSAYGNGTAYAAAWGDASAVLEVITTECGAPAFGTASYAFSVIGDAEVGASVGTVSATITGGTVSYFLNPYSEDERNDFRRFGIGENTGEITLAETLDYPNTSSYTLRVRASVERRGSAYVEVAVSVLPP